MEVQVEESGRAPIQQDQLERLPADVLLRVLNEVDLFQQGAAVLTCRRFKELLYSNPRTTLDLSIAPVRPPPNTSSLWFSYLFNFLFI
jgi:hypothetical protein